MANGILLMQGYCSILLAAFLFLIFSLRDRSANLWILGSILAGTASLGSVYGALENPMGYGFLMGASAVMTYLAVGLSLYEYYAKTPSNRTNFLVALAIAFTQGIVLAIIHSLSMPIAIQAGMYSAGVVLAASWVSVLSYRLYRATSERLIGYLSAILFIQTIVWAGRLLQAVLGDVTRLNNEAGSITYLVLIGASLELFKTVLYMALRVRETNQKKDKLFDLNKDLNTSLLMESRGGGVTVISAFAGMIVHELRDFIQVFKLNLQHVELEVSSGPRVNSGLSDRSTQSSSIDRLTESINDLSALTETLTSILRSGESLRTKVVVKKVVERAQTILEPDSIANTYHINIHCQCRGEPQVLVHEPMLLRMILSVVRNSVEAFQGASKDGQGLEVEIQCREEIIAEVPFVAIIISDNGPGYPPVTAKAYKSREEILSQSNSGVGLVLLKALAESWGGHVVIGTNDTVKCGGARTFIRLPLATRG